MADRLQPPTRLSHLTGRRGYLRRAATAVILAAAAGCAPPDRAPDDSAAVATPPAPATNAVAASRPDSAHPQPAPPLVTVALGDRIIDRGGIGPLRLGQTLAEARRTLPGATFTRASDGDGVVLVDVTLPTGGSVSVYAGEERPSAIDWSKRIQHLETFDSTFVTVEGVHVGSLVSDVEKVYGKVTSIDLSEIEARQYVSFERQPAGIQFRIDYSGDFPEGERQTTRYRPDAKIFSISVSR